MIKNTKRVKSAKNQQQQPYQDSLKNPQESHKTLHRRYLSDSNLCHEQMIYSSYIGLNNNSDNKLCRSSWKQPWKIINTSNSEKMFARCQQNSHKINPLVSIHLSEKIQRIKNLHCQRQQKYQEKLHKIHNLKKRENKNKIKLEDCHKLNKEIKTIILMWEGQRQLQFKRYNKKLFKIKDKKIFH